MKKSDIEMMTLCHQETEKIIEFYEERLEFLTTALEGKDKETQSLSAQNKALRRSLSAILTRLYEHITSN